MRKWLAILLSVLILLACIFPLSQLWEPIKADSGGPKNDFIFRTYDDLATAYEALKAGSIDILYGSSLTLDLLHDALNDQNLEVVEAVTDGMYLFELNNNYTIAEYPNVKSPLHELNFRRAIAYAINKTYIIEAFWQNMATRIDEPLPAVFTEWINETYSGEGYPYKYNITRAAELLDELGFKDTDGNGWRNYPSNWPGAPGADFFDFPLKVLIRSDHEMRRLSGEYLVNQLEALGIKCNAIFGDLSVLLDTVYRDRNYHIFTAGWRISPDALYFLYHSYYWQQPQGDFHYNTVTGMNESNLPNYPQLDKLLQDIYYASSFENAKQKVKMALGFFVENCINIPLATDIHYSAYRKEVRGIIKLNVSNWQDNAYISVLNRYSLLSAYKNDGSPIKVGLWMHIDELNILYADWPSEIQTCDMIYDDLIYFVPNDPANYRPWTSSWNIDLWYDPETGENKTKVTLYLTNSSYWIKPATGEVLGQMTAYDFEFTTWYTYQTPDAWHHYDVMNIHHIRVIDNFTIEVYFNASSIWYLPSLNYPIIPKQIWTNFQQLTELKTLTFIEGVNATTPGYLNLIYQDIGAPVAIESVKANSSDLTKYDDYNLEMGKLRIYDDLPNGTFINVTYWARGNPQGFVPGELPWQDILVGNGPFYITELDRTTGCYIYFKANPYYEAITLNRNIAITTVNVSKTTAKIGENITIYVNVENQGALCESFDLTIYANETTVESKQIYLPPNGSSFITFNWDTSSFNPGKYIVKAQAEILYGENNTVDNSYIDGEVTLTAPIIDIAITQLTPSKTTVNYGGTLGINVTVENQGEQAANFNVTLYANATEIGSINIANLAPQSSTILPFSWNTRGWHPGKYELAAAADILDGEIEIEDNYFTDGIITISEPNTYLLISPSSNEITLGDSLTVAVLIQNVTDLYGYDITIRYNTTLLNAIKLQEGPFLNSGGQTFIFANITNDEEGYVRFAISLLGAETGMNGSGVLFTIEFKATLQEVGIADLIFDYTELSDHNIIPIPHYTVNGQITVIEIDVEKYTVIKNETLYEVVAISNSTIHSLSYNESDYKVNLNVTGATGTVGFCNLTIPKPLFNGTIVVLVNGSPIAYTKTENETHVIITFTFHNSWSSIEILVTVFGDLNGDRIVDIFDVVIVCVAYGSKPGDPNWDPVADIIKNDLIDIFDAVAVCVNYGKTWQI